MKVTGILMMQEMVQALPYKTETRRMMRAGRNCRYGTAGDLLYVQETWATSRSLDHVKPSNLRAGFPREYRAGGNGIAPLIDRGRWRSSMFMPQHAARHWLEVVSVHAEPLQNITEAGAVAEGVFFYTRRQLGGLPEVRTLDGRSFYYHAGTGAARLEYRNLFDRINGRGEWEKNPLVWVIKFKPASKPK